MGRRAPNEGSVYARKVDGKIVAWVASVTVWKDGKRGRRKAERRTKREALEALAVLKTPAAPPRPPAPPLGPYADGWRAALQRRQTTLDCYELVLRRYILPHLGAETRLDDVDAPAVRRMRAALEKDHTPRVVALALAVGRSLFADAIEAGDCAGPNPFDEVKAPKVPRGPMKALTPTQARTFLAALRGSFYELPLTICLSLGLRRGEVCGLRLDDVDLDEGRLHVRGNLTRTTKGVTYGPPKSESGERTLRLTAGLAAALRWHIETRATVYGAKGWKDSPYLFYSPQTGGPLLPERLTEVFQQVATDAGLTGFTLHSLRHSCASFLHAQRVPLATISAILGHSNTAITSKVYTHIFQPDMDDAVDAVDALIRKRSG